MVGGLEERDINTEQKVPVRNGEWECFTSWLRKSTRRPGEQSSALQSSILDDIKKESERVTRVLKEGNPEPVQAELKETLLWPPRQAARAGE